MKHLKCLPLFVFLICTGISFAQTLEVVDFGPVSELDKNIYLQQIVGHDEDGFYIVKSEGYNGLNGDNLWLEYYSNLTMTLEAKNQIVLPSVNGINTKYARLFYIEKKLILFSIAMDETQERQFLYVQYLDQNGTIKNKPKKIGEIPLKNNPEHGFGFILTENGTKITVYYHNTFMTYNNEPFTFKVIDSNLQVEFNEELVMPLEGRKFEMIKADVGTTGFIYLLVKALQDDGKKNKTSKTDSYEFMMLVYNTEKAEIKSYPIEIQKYFPSNVTFTLNAKEEIVVCGFFSAKTTKVAGEFIGAFYLVIDPRIEKFLPPPGPKDYFLLFDKEFLGQNAQERNGLLPEQYNNYIIKDMFTLSNGGYILLAENYFETVSTYTDPQTKKETKLTYFNYNDIIAIGVSREGKMAFAKRIAKNQNSLDDYGYYSSYYATVDFSKVKIMFNDNPANASKEKPLDKLKVIKFLPEKAPKSTAYMVTIYTDGSFEKDPMFSGKDEKTAIIPRMIYKKEDRYITVSMKGKVFKFGGFFFE